MHIALGADHRGFALKELLKVHLLARSFSVEDLGAATLIPDDDYPDLAVAVARWVAEMPEERRGILMCGSGAGMAVAANKLPRIRATLVTSVEIARASRHDDDVNILVLPADYMDEIHAKTIVDTWLATPFSGEERHRRRIEKIHSLEPFL